MLGTSTTTPVGMNVDGEYLEVAPVGLASDATRTTSITHDVDMINSHDSHDWDSSTAPTTAGSMVSQTRGVWCAPTPEYTPVDTPVDNAARVGASAESTVDETADAPPSYVTLFLGDRSTDADNAESSL